jgi:hypothetical protein
MRGHRKARHRSRHPLAPRFCGHRDDRW